MSVSPEDQLLHVCGYSTMKTFMDWQRILFRDVRSEIVVSNACASQCEQPLCHHDKWAERSVYATKRMEPRLCRPRPPPICAQTNVLARHAF